MSTAPALAQSSSTSGNRTRQKSGYLATLDGWRAIAILAVILFHDDPHRIGPLSTNALHSFGWAGVDLFFAISGLLICSRILEEERVTGSISIRGFYIRRFFRILPAAYLFLIVYLLLCLVRRLPVGTGGWITSVLMVRNLWASVSGDPPLEAFTDHFWSLSVEEHFYLLLPAILVFVRPRAKVLAVLAVLACLWTFAVARATDLATPALHWRTDLRIHGLLIPASFALLLAKPDFRARAARLLHPVVAFGIFGVLGFVVLKLHLHQVFGPVLIPVCFPLLVASTMLNPATFISRLLEFAPLKFVGRMSYSLYLWQQLFFIKSDAAPSPLHDAQFFPLNYIATFACALASYYLIEKPFIRLGHKAAPPATPGRQDLSEAPDAGEQHSTVPAWNREHPPAAELR